LAETDGRKPKPPGAELPVVQKAVDLAREMTERTRKLPRDLKFVLGDRMLATSYDVLDLLIEAKYSREKAGLLRRANLLLERLRFQVRLCMEERFISVRQYEYISEMIHETGSMIGGWIRSLKE
jgi:hypothetical protein